MNRDKKLLEIFKDRTEISFDEISVELGISERDAYQAVRHLITKKLFTGYVNWGEGLVCPRPDMTIEETNCPACGSAVKTTPRGTKKCVACGAELCFGDAMGKRLLAAYDVEGLIENSEDMDESYEPRARSKGDEDELKFPYLKVCGRCGAKVDIGGKLKTACPYCGAEVF